MRIGSNLSGVDRTAQHYLGRAVAQLNKSALRLSTLRRINRGSDDPSGLIAAKRLEAELTSLEAAGENTNRAVSLVHIADAALGSVGGLVQTIRGNVLEAAQGWMSDTMRAAKQLEVDAALEGINRIGAYTSRLIPTGTLTFRLSPDGSDTTKLTIPSISTATLGGQAGRLAELASGGTASLAAGDPAKTLEILDAAQGHVLQARAELGAFEKYTLESTQAVFGQMEESLTSALSMIEDVDVALETSRFVRAQILCQAGLSTLMLAGTRPSMLGVLQPLDPER